jgi:protein SCO1/2
MSQAPKITCLSYVLVLLTTFCSIAAQAATKPALEQASALTASQAALGRSVGDMTLLDREGRAVRLSSYRGKPLLVSFIYTGCFQVCPATTRALQKAVLGAEKALGKNRFNIVSIGFNQPTDSPQALKDYATKYNISQPNWEFLSLPAARVEALTRDFGFSFVATPAGFDHILQVSIVDGEGRIYRQIYGESYATESLVESLRQLLDGKPVADDGSGISLVERIRILCSVYDPLTGEYRLRYGLVLEIIGGLTFLLWFIWFFFDEWLARRNARKRLNA